MGCRAKLHACFGSRVSLPIFVLTKPYTPPSQYSSNGFVRGHAQPTGPWSRWRRPSWSSVGTSGRLPFAAPRRRPLWSSSAACRRRLMMRHADDTVKQVLVGRVVRCTARRIYACWPACGQWMPGSSAHGLDLQGHAERWTVPMARARSPMRWTDPTDLVTCSCTVRFVGKSWFAITVPIAWGVARMYPTTVCDDRGASRALTAHPEACKACDI